MERTKILYGTDRAEQIANTNNISRSRLVLMKMCFGKILEVFFFFFRSGQLQLPTTSQQQAQSSDNKQLTTTEASNDEITSTRSEISYPYLSSMFSPHLII